MYQSDMLSSAQIARELHISTSQVNYWLKKYGIRKRSISEAIYLQHNPDGDPFVVRMPSDEAESKLYGIGIGLYWGEGNKANTHAVRLGNTDPGIILTFIDFLETFFGVHRKDMRYGLQIFSDTDADNAQRFWQQKLSAQLSQFYKTTVTISGSVGTYRRKNTTGVLTVYYHNKKLRDILVEQINNMPR